MGRLYFNDTLSHREQEIIRMLLKGYKSTQIQKILGITEPTLKTHLSNIYGKRGVNSMPELILNLYAERDEDLAKACVSVAIAQDKESLIKAIEKTKKALNKWSENQC